MIVFGQEYSDYLRQMYIDRFVDKECDYYKQYIEKLKSCNDGIYYNGYLWDVLKQPDYLHCKLGTFPVPIPERKIQRILWGKKNVYVMMDLHSSEENPVGLWTQDQRDFRMKYRKRVVCIEEWPNEIEKSFPKDIYLFDDSLKWSFVLTHEWYGEDSRLCYVAGEFE